MTTNALITGWGMYAPSRVMTNDDLPSSSTPRTSGS